MRIAFFHIGKRHGQADMFCKSVKRAFGHNVEIIQISDLATPKIKEAGKILRLKECKRNKMMYWRMIGYRDLLKLDPGPTVFFDTDILVTKKFKINFDGRPFLCQRSYNKNKILADHVRLTHHDKSFRVSFEEHKNKKLGALYPYVGCFYADNDCLFLDEAIKVYNSLGEQYQFWFGDQIALREAARIIPFLTLPESIVACSPAEYISEQKDAVAVHFKGDKDKLLMEKMFIKMNAGSSR